MDPFPFLGQAGPSGQGSNGQQQQQQQSYQQQQQQPYSGGMPPDLVAWLQQQQQQPGNQMNAQYPFALDQLPQQQQQQTFEPPYGGSAIKAEQQQQRQQPQATSSSAQVKQESSTGPIRPPKSKSSTSQPKAAPANTEDDSASNTAASNATASGSKGSGRSGPVRAACLFCRARKSRCNGQQPCHNCINRGREDDCIFTVSRRGGKPKPKGNQSQEEANLEQHLKRLFSLSKLPSQVRVPGAIPQLVEAQREDQQDGTEQQSPTVGSTSQIPPFPTNQTPFAAMAGSPSSAVGSTNTPGLQPILSAPNQQQGQDWNSMAAFYAAMNGSYTAQPDASNMAANGAPLTSTASYGGPSMAQAAANPQPPRLSWQMPQQEGSQADVRKILLGYYNSLYRFIPVFLPPEYIDQMASRLSADSPFILALQAILPLLQDGDGQDQGQNRSGGQTSEPSNFAAGFGIGPGNSGLNFPSAERKKELLALTSAYERRASEAIEAVLEKAEGHLQGQREDLTSQGSTLGVIQALAVLCVYHYGSGRALKARLKADQALGLAMAKGLHRLKPSDALTEPSSATKSSFVSTSTERFGRQTLFSDLPELMTYELKKRIWWTCWSSSLWCSYNTAIVPTIRADDPRVRTEPPMSVVPDVWSANIKSLQSLLLIQERVLALSNLKDSDPSARATIKPGQASGSTTSNYAGSSTGGDTPRAMDPPAFASLPSNATRQEILDSMSEMDQFLQGQIGQIEADAEGFKQLCEAPASVALAGEQALGRVEEDLARYLKRSAAIQLYTSSLTLHLGQAFQGASLFERKLCFLNTVKESDTSAACQVPMPDTFSSIFGNGTEHDGAPQANQLQLVGGAASSSSAQDLFARGPFLPKDSLNRCVHASKRLLEIAKSKGKEPNPFNACSFVLISFTLLMQALAVSSGSQDGEEEGAVDDDYDEGDEDLDGNMSTSQGPNGDGDFDMDSFLQSANEGGNSGVPMSLLSDNPDFQAFSRGLLQSAQGAAALGGMGLSQDSGTATTGQQQSLPWSSLDASSSNDTTSSLSLAEQQRKKAKLREIWSRVREAHGTLKDLSRYWKMVEPMADEVNMCLETSQLLLM